MRTLFELQYEKQVLESKHTDQERSKEIVQRMEENIDSIIKDKAKVDILSSIYSRYEKVPPEWVVLLFTVIFLKQ